MAYKEMFVTRSNFLWPLLSINTVWRNARNVTICSEHIKPKKYCNPIRCQALVKLQC